MTFREEKTERLGALVSDILTEFEEVLLENEMLRARVAELEAGQRYLLFMCASDEYV